MSEKSQNHRFATLHTVRPVILTNRPQTALLRAPRRTAVERGHPAPAVTVHTAQTDVQNTGGAAGSGGQHLGFETTGVGQHPAVGPVARADLHRAPVPGGGWQVWRD